MGRLERCWRICVCPKTSAQAAVAHHMCRSRQISSKRHFSTRRVFDEASFDFTPERVAPDAQHLGFIEAILSFTP